jgi:hypothetical protein
VKVNVGEILSLKSEDEERLNSHALKRLNDCQAEILSKVPQLRQLSVEQVKTDLATHLDENEIAEFNKCLADIKLWLSECMDTGDRYFSYAYATWVVTPMLRVESLIIKVYQRVEAERRKKEYDARWRAAFVSIKPPFSDSKK